MMLVLAATLVRGLLAQREEVLYICIYIYIYIYREREMHVYMCVTCIYLYV